MTDEQILDWIEKYMPSFRRINATTVEMTFVSPYAFEVIIGDSARDCVTIVLLDEQVN